MSAAVMDRYAAHARRAEAAFDRWVPEYASDPWLAETCGPPRFTWDTGAVARGFNVPLRRSLSRCGIPCRAVLASVILECFGVDASPEHAGVALVVCELPRLAALLVEDIANGRTAAESSEGGLDLPLPVLVTAAYTARQFAASLVARHAPGLAPAARARLLRTVTRTIGLGGIGGVAGAHARETGVQPASDAQYVAFVRLFVAPAVFCLAGACALGFAGPAAGARDGAFDGPGALLQRVLEHAGAAYRLAVEYQRPGGPPLGREPRLPWPPPLREGDRAAAVARGVRMMRGERDAAEETLRALHRLGGTPGGLAPALAEFIALVVDGELAKAEGRPHAS
jgi:hypothetical protein